MLKSITIKDFAIISDLSLSFGPGLNIFTGETGAGKSIVIEALGFALGARGDAGLIRHGAQKMIVEAGFSSASLPAAIKTKYGITADTFTLRRELDQKSKGRCSINNKPVLVADLDELGSNLVDFHGQHEHQALFKAAAHLDILDGYANLSKDLAAYKKVYEEAQDIKAKITAISLSTAEKEKLSDLYTFQLAEIEKISPRPGEEAEIEAALPKLKHAAKLKEYAQAAHNLLSGMDNSATELLAKARRYAEDMAALDPALQDAASSLNSALAGAQDSADTLASYASDTSADPQALDNLLSRQEALRKLKQKYGPAIEDVLNTAASLKKKISDLETGEHDIRALEAALAAARQKQLSLSEALYQKRAKAAAKLSAEVVKEITPLGFEQVRFEAALEHSPADPGPKGADSVEFLFSSNPGSALRPLRFIASGGEISRLMLGLKTVLAGGTPVMVFDEIDTGISGATGKLAGQKLKKVSAARQVLCVTHLAQVAAYGDCHFSVSKAVKNKNTEVSVTLLEGAQIAQEIARMIGSTQTASAGFKHAQDLLAEAAENLVK